MKVLDNVAEQQNLTSDGIMNEEEINQRFLKGKLIFRPEDGSDVGRLELPISSLQNPLESTFDLSQCGDSGDYLSISTGYRKKKKKENAGKVEIWIAPRFLIQKELETSASHFKGMMGSWDETSPIGIFWTWGGWDHLSDFDYLVTRSFDDFHKEDLCKLRTHAEQIRGGDGNYSKGVRNGPLFHMSFVN